jgi:hypothetical protein
MSQVRSMSAASPYLRGDRREGPVEVHKGRTSWENATGARQPASQDAVGASQPARTGGVRLSSWQRTQSDAPKL